VAASALVLVVTVGSELTVTQTWVSNLSSRFSLQTAVEVASQTPLEAVALLLDIFDYTAFMVLRTSPLAALIGTGPGLIVLPGSQFIPTTERWSWLVETGQGITSLPSMGLLVEWSNGGVIAVLLWVAFVVSCYRAMTRLAQRNDADSAGWRLGRGAFVLMAATYAVQASALSATWPILMGLGIGAAALELQPVRLPMPPLEAIPAPAS
jgi:hypothetical protein